jgi:nucleotide-binding universal stress UspA family protein
LQETILKCLHPEAAKRYPSAAHLAMDLSNPEQIRITERGRQLKGAGFKEHLKRWIKAAGMHYQASPLPSEQIKEVPIVMVALPHADVSDATWYSLREAVDRSLGIRPGARLACVTIISSSDTSSTESHKSESSVHRMHLARMQQWSQGLDLHDHQISFHVFEAGDVADALVKYAECNEVSMIIMGAATHGLQLQRLVATVPIKVAMDAPCTVILVKQDVPFEFLGTLNEQ